MSMTWFLSSILAAIFLAIGFLLAKKLSLESVSLPVMLFFIWGISSIILLGYLLYSKQPIHLSSPILGLLVLAAVAIFLGQLFLYNGIYTAPNPGYATAIGSIQVLIVVLLSLMLFGLEFSLLKIVATILILIGVIILGL